VCLQRRRGTRAFNAAMDVTLTGGGIAREFNLAILGGCCWTDERYIEALAKAAVDHGESAA